jgi:hypothetical protein
MSSTKAEFDNGTLLSGAPIVLPNICTVYPPSMREILDNFSKYQENVFSIIGDMKKVQKLDDKIDISNFELIMLFCIKNEEYKEKFIRALSFFTKQEITILPEIFAVQIGQPRLRENLLTKENFPELQRIVRAISRQGEYDLEESENQKVQEILQKFKERKEVLSRANKDDTIDVPTMVSCLALRYQDFEKVLDMKYYTFLDQFIRMGYEEDYDTNLRSALAGAKVPKNKMKYWVRPIQEEK